MPHKCKKKQAAAARKHYLKNKDKVKKRAKEFTKKAVIRNKSYVHDYLRHHACVDCGESDIRVLEFDHVRGEKSGCVSTFVRNGSSISRIQSEINKCEVRCANCHRKKTYETIWIAGKCNGCTAVS